MQLAGRCWIVSLAVVGRRGVPAYRKIVVDLNISERVVVFFAQTFLIFHALTRAHLADIDAQRVWVLGLIANVHIFKPMLNFGCFGLRADMIGVRRCRYLRT